MLPFTPITEELLPRNWIEVEYPVLEPALKRPRDSAITEEWKVDLVFRNQPIFLELTR